MVVIALRGLNRQNKERCLIKGLQRKMGWGGQTPNSLVVSEHYDLACMFFFITNYSHFCCCLWTININKSQHLASILAAVSVLLGSAVTK